MRKSPWYRFIILIFICFETFFMAFSWSTFSAIDESYKTKNKVSDALYAVISSSYPLFYFFFNFPSCLLIQKTSNYTSMILSLIVLTLGSIIKIFSYSFWIIALLGQSIGACSQPFFYNMYPCLLIAWFKKEEIILAFGVVVSFDILGSATSFFYPSFFFDNLDIDKFNTQFIKYTTIPAAVLLIILILAVFLIKNKGDTYEDTYENDKKSEIEKFTIKNTFVNNKSFIDVIKKDKLIYEEEQTNSNNEQTDIETIIKNEENPENINLRKIFKDAKYLIKHNPNFVYLTINYGFVYGYYNYFYNINVQLLQKYNISETDSNYYAVYQLVSGIVGSILFSIMAKLWFKVKNLLMISSILLILSKIFYSLFLELNFDTISYKPIFIILNIIIGFNLSCSLILSQDFLLELTYPMNEAIAMGIMISFAQFYCFLMVIVLPIVISNSGHLLVYALIILSFSVGLVSIYKIKDDHRKTFIK